MVLRLQSLQPMQHFRLPFILLILITNLAVILSNSLALAAVRCEKVHGRFFSVQSQQESILKLGNLKNHYIDLFQSATTEKKISAEWMQKTEQVTEAYFQMAGISYEKRSVTREHLHAGDIDFGSLTYNVYDITDASHAADENAKMLRGFLELKQNVSLTYDPFLIFNLDQVQALFQREQKKIIFTFSAFVDRSFGLQDELRHEIKHAFENSKIEKRQHSLARFELFGKPEEGNPYSSFFALDELETHLLDLRGLVNLAPRRQQKLDRVLNSQFVRTLEVNREARVDEEFKTLNQMIKRSKSVLQELESRLKQSHPDSGGWESPELAFFKFDDLASTRYVQARILISGDYRTTTPPHLVEQALLEIQWSMERIREIERQIRNLKTKA